MPHRFLTILFALFVVAAAPGQTPDMRQVRIDAKSLGPYKHVVLNGFTTYYSQAVIASDVRYEAVRNNLATVLDDLVQTLPAEFLPLAKTVPIWIDDAEGPPNYTAIATRMMITPTPAPPPRDDTWYVPLPHDGRVSHSAESRAGGIMIMIKYLLTDEYFEWRSRVQKGWMLHEFAHALQDRFIGLRAASVRKVFNQAMDRRLYDSVEVVSFGSDGVAASTTGPAYARTDDCEYFAELTCAYFDRCTQYYPHTRRELEAHDPGGFKLVEAFWRGVVVPFRNDYPCELTLVGETTVGYRYSLGKAGATAARTVIVPLQLTLVVCPEGEAVMRLSPAEAAGRRFTPPADYFKQQQLRLMRKHAKLLDE